MYDRLVVSGFYTGHLSCHPPQQTASQADQHQQVSEQWALLLFILGNKAVEYEYDWEIIDEWQNPNLENGLHVADNTSSASADIISIPVYS